ncbi:hypothetical protein [uncultured Tateyamaria sp.]|uniref:hypothetical protein n=1 Tax=uncultured Tateyamaria sp. TaxID=455651 RepID=UPI00260B1D1D|nr:hypothetical protein [uncultured Tateyamaria sp.]
MRSYEAARGLFSFLGVCSWIVIIIGGIIALGGMSAGSSFGRNAGAMQAIMGAAPGVILAMLGFFGLALVQMGRASVDSAEYGQQSLQVAREQLEVSRQSLKQGKQLAASYAAQVTKTQPAAVAATENQPVDEVPSYGARGKDDTQVAPGEPATSLPAENKQAALPTPGIETPVAELLGEKVTIAGRDLILEDGTYRYGSMSFSSREKAEAYFGQMGVNPNAKVQST